jgi:hypothetical protein
VAEAAPVAAPLRVALLARPGAAAERLREALAGIGVELVLEADPLQADPQALAAAAPQAVVVVLDPAVEDALERFDPVLSDPALDVLYEEAELAVAREGWDAARWGRHLSAKLLRHGDVLPPGREADPGSGQEDLSELQPGRPPTPAELAERAVPYRFDEAEASRLAAELPSSAVGMFDPVAAEYDQAGAPGPFDEAGFDLAAGFADAAEAAVEAPPAGSASDGPGPEPEPEAEPAPAGAGDPGKAGPDGGSRYRRDLADLERRIAGLSLEDGPGQGAGDQPPSGPIASTAASGSWSSSASPSTASGPSGSRNRRRPGASRADSAAASGSGGSIAGTRARPHCSQAAASTPRQCATRRCSRAPSSRTSLRSLSTGSTAATPSSVAFCRIQSIFSPRATPCSRVSRSGDSLPTGTPSSTSTSTSRRPMLATRPG